MAIVRKIGFDIGDVMGPDLPKRRNPDGTYRLVQPFEDCIEVLTELGQEYQPDNLFVISRALDPVSVRANWDLLHSWDFFSKTKLPKGNVHIYEDAVGDPSIKGHIAEELRLTSFVDDKRKVLDTMPESVRNLYQVLGERTKPEDYLCPPRFESQRLYTVSPVWAAIKAVIMATAR